MLRVYSRCAAAAYFMAGMLSRNSAAIIVLAGFIVFAGVAKSKAAGSDEEVDRTKALEAALTCNDAAVRFRAVMELGFRCSNGQPGACKRLVQFVVETMNEEENQEAIIRGEENPDVIARIAALAALADAGEAAIPAIRAALQEKKVNAAGQEQLMFALGKMGPKARAAIPMFEARLKDPNVTEGQKMVFRVLLANVGWQSPENAAVILSEVKRGTPAGYEAVHAMAEIQASGVWVKDDMVAALFKWLKTDQPGPDLMDVVSALGALGERASGAERTLARLMEEEAEKKHEPSSILFGFAHARVVGPKKHREAIRRLLKQVGSAAQENVGGVWFFLEDKCVRLITDAEIREATEALSDPDPQVVGGAAWTLGVCGLRASSAAPAMLEVLKKYYEKPMNAGGGYNLSLSLGRMAVESNLAMVADETFLPVIEKLLQSEKAALRMNAMRLEGVVRTMKLQPSKY